jgi:hypothetical protein
MWCIGELTAEYRRRMYDLLTLYARPYDPREPVICLDEKSKQLLRETRSPLPAKVATPVKPAALGTIDPGLLGKMNPYWLLDCAHDSVCGGLG